MARDYVSVVKALLNKSVAEGVTKEESEALEIKAFEIMAEHQVTAAMVTGHADAEPDAKIHRKFTFANPYGKQRSILFSMLARQFGCRVILSKDVYHLFGFESDYQRMWLLYTILVNQALEKLSRMTAKDIPAHDNLRSYKIGWWYGYTNTISSRLTAARESEEGKVTGSAIALRDRSDEVDSEMRKEFPHTRSMPAPVARSHAGFGNGREAGEKATLHASDSVQNNQRMIH